jgi:CubicO group peptidase (beta-lactamase class C family)
MKSKHDFKEAAAPPYQIRLLTTIRVAFLFTAMFVTITALGETERMTERFDALFQDYNHTNTPGLSVMVIQNGKLLFAKGYGMASLEERIAVQTNTNFRLASVSKQFTAMATLMLVERKKLSLDEQLTDVFPEFPAYGKNITVRHLLTHTSGLVDYEDVIPSGTQLPVLDRDVLRLLMQQDKTLFTPGAKFRYSNSGYALLAQIVEVRAKVPFAAFLKDNIFQPLHMNDTVAFEQGISYVSNRAYGYSPQGKAFHRTDQSLTSSVLGDGGIYSSVSDLYRWDQALYSDKLIGSNLLQLAFSDQTSSDRPDAGYGFGWYVGKYRGSKEIWHSGNTIGFSTRIVRYPEKKFTVIILCNRVEAKLSDFPHEIADWFIFP